MWGRGYGCVVFVGGIGGGRDRLFGCMCMVFGFLTRRQVYSFTFTHILTFSLFSFHSFCTARRDA